MTSEFTLPDGLGFGPGSQKEPDGQEPDHMEMPREMVTFDLPIAPEPEDTIGMEAGKARLNALQKLLAGHKIGQRAAVLELGDLDPENLGLVNQILGEGEVSLVSGSDIQVQEAVFAGVWRVLHFEDGKVVRDTVEVADWPHSVADRVFGGAAIHGALATDPLPESVFNAPSILTEIADAVANYSPGTPAHSINLSLLPHTEQDLEYLADKLGVGDTIILSRGYGNCRVSATRTKNVWWVQYYNSQDALILNSIEIINVPEVVCAAQEDIDDSAERLAEVMDTYND
jgi:hydrogenase-1 operon protein HyaF